MSLQVTATTASGRRPAPEWLLRVNRFTTRDNANSASDSPVEKVEEIDVEGKAGIVEASVHDVTSRDYATMSPTSPTPNSYATPDNGSVIVESSSEMIHRGSGSAVRISGSPSTATVSATGGGAVDIEENERELDLSVESPAPLKSVRFPEPRE